MNQANKSVRQGSVADKRIRGPQYTIENHQCITEGPSCILLFLLSISVDARALRRNSGRDDDVAVGNGTVEADLGPRRCGTGGEIRQGGWRFYCTVVSCRNISERRGVRLLPEFAGNPGNSNRNRSRRDSGGGIGNHSHWRCLSYGGVSHRTRTIGKI